MRSHQKGRTRRRSGFSIVEVLVALLLVSVGLLGVAGTCALSVRGTGQAARERRAVRRAADRIAVLASEGCAAAHGGSLVDSSALLTERWTVSTPRNGAALVDAEVRWAAPSGSRSVLLGGALLC